MSTETEHLCESKPVREHKWLEKLLGDWTYESEGDMGPDKPKIKSSGSESVRSLGGLWIIAEGVGKMPDGVEGQTRMTIGYNPRTKRYPGTWVGSMMDHMWIYDGEMDKSETKLTLNAEGPSFTDSNKMTNYQDIIEIVNDDERLLRSQFQTESGDWVQFMLSTYKRKK